MPDPVAPPAPEATPAEGGSYLRQSDGSLARQVPSTPISEE